MVNSTKCGFFDYFNNFWEEARREPFSLSEVAVFHYLLNEANQRHWVMPFRCSTAMMCLTLGTTKQNVMKVREQLRNRGIISFEKGAGTNSPATYRLTIAGKNFTPQLTGQLSGQFTHNKYKDKEENNNGKRNYDFRRGFEVQASKPSDYEGAF
ncbi:MAG: hypothetical protein HUJ98_03145 [Bacteroidaceae bacterium]|nr:hypothetical protein [Bacteroidaceae bacterium]